MMELTLVKERPSLTAFGVDPSNVNLDEEFTVLLASPTSSELSALEDDENTTHTDDPKGKSVFQLNPHLKYFFEDGNLLIRVENVDFKVHRYFFMRDSPRFRQLSKNGTIGRIFDNGAEDAADDTIPLVLKHLASLDFERFLGVLYPTRFGNDEENTSAYWASVLWVSSYLSFKSIRSLAIERLSIIATPIDKISMGRRCGIHHWLRDAYREICTRRAPLTKEEGRRVGADELVAIMEARQILLWESPTAQEEEQYKVINRIFGLDFYTTTPVTVSEKDLSDPQLDLVTRPALQQAPAAPALRPVLSLPQPHREGSLASHSDSCSISSLATTSSSVASRVRSTNTPNGSPQERTVAGSNNRGRLLGSSKSFNTRSPPAKPAKPPQLGAKPIPMQSGSGEPSGLWAQLLT
ncbi:hypothetical protein AX16_008954 [Volvariella volvacea WC 439]|nr:hypothetical protein AX16_008954 [Volvariella volvacea WC 439]